MDIRENKEAGRAMSPGWLVSLVSDGIPDKKDHQEDFVEDGATQTLSL